MFITSTLETASYTLASVNPPATMRCSFEVTAVVQRRFVGIGGKTTAQLSFRLSSLFVHVR